MMTKEQKKLSKKIKLTREQEKALVDLDMTFKDCNDLGLDFVYDYSIKKLVAVNLNDAEMHYCEEDCVDDDSSIVFDQIGTSCLPGIDMGDVMWEVGRETYYTDEFDRVCFTPKED